MGNIPVKLFGPVVQKMSFREKNMDDGRQKPDEDDHR